MHSVNVIRWVMIALVMIAVRAPGAASQRTRSDAADSAAGRETVLFSCWVEDGDFHMDIYWGDSKNELALEGQAEDILARFDRMYDILENLRRGEERKLTFEIKALSRLLIEPFASQISRCGTVRFVVDDDTVGCAFDLLLHEGQYLFLQRPVCYQYAEGKGADKPKIEVNSALCLADLTADPEKAGAAVSQMIPRSIYRIVQKASLDLIEEQGSKVDALIISAHGELDEDGGGSMEINGETLTSDVIASLGAQLVYFDSCQQGINVGFLDAFQESSDVWFYLAPIISNDAGDSSTKTMVTFFSKVLDHADPIRALFETRKYLYDYYTNKKQLNPVICLNKSFPFRIYEFVDEDDSESED